VSCLALGANWARAQAPTQDSEGVQVDAAGDAVLHRTYVAYPPDLLAKGVQGTVMVKATVDGAGNAVDATALSGPDELRKAAVESVSKWQFAPGEGKTRFVRIVFRPPLDPRVDPLTKETLRMVEEDISKMWRGVALTSQLMNDEVAKAREQLAALQNAPDADAGQVDAARRRLTQLQTKLALAQQPLVKAPNLDDRERQIQLLRNEIHDALQRSVGDAGSEEQLRLIRARLVQLTGLTTPHMVPGRTGAQYWQIGGIEVRGVSEAGSKELLARLPLHEGDRLTTDSIEASRQAVKQFDDRLVLRIARDGDRMVMRIVPEQ
jgi:TonB family protein